MDTIEKFVKFQPIQDDYRRYMRERERNREKRPPENLNRRFSLTLYFNPSLGSGEMVFKDA